METGLNTIRESLRENADPAYKKFQSSLIPGVENFLGVRRPVLKRMARRIAACGGRRFLREADGETYEEIMLRGLVIGELKAKAAEELEDVIAEIENYIPEITDWCLCDTFCSALKIVKKNRERFWDFLGPYLVSEREFEARFGAVMLLTHYIGEGWTDRTLHALFKVRQQGYYAQMAVAWAYSLCLIREPELTEEFLTAHPLPDFTRRKTISKIMDSQAVPDERKARIREIMTI